MSTSVVAYHTGSPCHGCTGIADMWAEFNKAGVRFGVYSVEGGGIIQEAIQFARADPIIYRTLATDVAAYELSPDDAAARTWSVLAEKLPPEVEANRGRVWVEIGNEQDKTRADWLGWYYVALAGRAKADNYRICGPAWSTGEPEPEHWSTPGWLAYLRLCAANPSRLAISTHEYSLDAGDIMANEPWLVGRVKFLFDTCKANGIAPPQVFITEAGWVHNSMPDGEKAKRDIAALATRYAQYPTVRAAFLWTLIGGGDKRQLAADLNALMPWLTRYTIETDVPGGAEQPPPDDGEEPMINLLTNGSFDDGWTDASDFPGQHPNGWSLAWNTGAAADGYQYQIGEAVHKNAALLPAAEREVFIWDGQWTYKVFAANRAIWPRLKQTVNLPGGVYRLTTPVWTDCYHWQGGKNYNLDPRHIEWQVKVNGQVVADWRQLTAGRRETPSVEFVHGGGAAELAVHLRARWPVASNNFWLDGWSLEEVAEQPPPPPPPVKHKAIIVKLPQELTAAEWQRGAEYAFGLRHTMTASHDDMLTILSGGNAESYVKLAWPSRPSQVFAAGLIEAAGYRWEPLFEVQPTPSPFDSAPTL